MQKTTPKVVLGYVFAEYEYICFIFNLIIEQWKLLQSKKRHMKR